MSVWVNLGFKWRGFSHGAGLAMVWGLFVWSVSKESEMGVFKHLKSSLRPFERILSLEVEVGVLAS